MWTCNICQKESPFVPLTQIHTTFSQSHILEYPNIQSQSKRTKKLLYENINHTKHCTFVSQYKSKRYGNTHLEPTGLVRLQGFANTAHPGLPWRTLVLSSWALTSALSTETSGVPSIQLLGKTTAVDIDNKSIHCHKMPSFSRNNKEQLSFVQLIRPRLQSVPVGENEPNYHHSQGDFFLNWFCKTRVQSGKSIH